MGHYVCIAGDPEINPEFVFTSSAVTLLSFKKSASFMIFFFFLERKKSIERKLSTLFCLLAFSRSDPHVYARACFVSLRTHR